MIKILANNVRDYIKANFDTQYKNFANMFENCLFNVKMPFDEFSIRIDSDTEDGSSILYFKKDEHLPQNYDYEVKPSLDCYKISYQQKHENGNSIEVAQLLIWVHEDGRFYTQIENKNDKYAYEMRQSKEQIEMTKGEKERGTFSLVTHSLLFTALLTIQFMHCKNVKLVENVERYEKRKPKQKTRVIEKKFYVLNIEPLKEVLKSEGNIIKNGLGKALHICRGHFKTYSEKGLFGKIKGTFWFPQHIKGNAEHGEVVKDYNVKVTG